MAKGCHLAWRERYLARRTSVTPYGIALQCRKGYCGKPSALFRGFLNNLDLQRVLRQGRCGLRFRLECRTNCGH